MNRCVALFALLAIVLLAAAPAGAQITITYAEMQTLLVNSTMMSHVAGYTVPASINLGTPSASSQTFDFSSVPVPGSLDSVAQQYVTPAGQPGASSFPTATLCTPYVDSTTMPGAQLTIVSYYRLQSNGFYLLGQYSRTYFPPFLNQTSIDKYSPMRLLFPLPLSYGATATTTDTTVTDSANHDYRVTKTIVAVDGWGDITFPVLTGLAGIPKTMAVSCLRGTETQSEDVYAANLFVTRNKYITEIYITADGTILIAEQGDSSFAGGTASVTSLALSSKAGGATDVRQTSPAVPEGFSLSQNYPNPFNPATTIAFSVPSSGHVTLAVYDLLGRQVATLVDRQMSPGSYETRFDAAGLPSGMYIYRLVSGSYTETRKMNVVK
jgi:hypothetical protein